MHALLAFIFILSRHEAAPQEAADQKDLTAAASELPTALAKARAAGVPLMAVEIAPTPRVKVFENAAPLIREASKAYDALPDANRGHLMNACAVGDYKTAARYIKEASYPLALADKAAAMPGCDFGHNWDLGPEIRVPELPQIEMLVKMLSFRAEVQASQGDSRSAVASLRGARRLSEDSEADPLLFGMLSRSAFEAILLRSAQQCLTLAKSPRECKDYAAFLAEKRPPVNVEGVLKCEAFMGVTTLRNFDQFGGLEGLQGLSSGGGVSKPPLDPKLLRRSGMPTDVTSKAFMARHLEMWAEFLTLEKSGRYGPIGLFKEMAVISENAMSKHEVSYTAEAIFDPDFSGVGVSIVRNDANWATTAALAKVVLYRSEHGSFPPNLQAAGVTNLDPFSRQPLKYVSKGTTAMVYSVGADGVDNHGQRRTGPASAKGPWDEVASFPPPPRQSFKLTR